MREKYVNWITFIIGVMYLPFYILIILLQSLLLFILSFSYLLTLDVDNTNYTFKYIKPFSHIKGEIKGFAKQIQILFKQKK